MKASCPAKARLSYWHPCRSDVQNGKPHPEPYLKAAAMLAAKTGDCLVVEDAPAGITAGKRAGCRVLALRTTMAEPLLKAAGPDWIADSCADLRALASPSAGPLKLLLSNQATNKQPLVGAERR